MEIYFKNQKLAKIFNSEKLLRKHYGDLARKIMQRMDDLRQAENLAVVMKLPGKHHALSGDRQGQFACSLGKNYRLIYEPADEPLPLDEQGVLILEKITIIEIIEVTDYH